MLRLLLALNLGFQLRQHDPQVNAALFQANLKHQKQPR